MVLRCGTCGGRKRIGNIVCWVCKGHGFIGTGRPHSSTREATSNSEPNARSDGERVEGSPDKDQRINAEMDDRRLS